MISIAEQFTPPGCRIVSVLEYGSGNVNDTFLVTVNSGGTDNFILQRINRRVFKKPELIMENMRIITDHVCKRQNKWTAGPVQSLQIPSVIRTRDKKEYIVNSSGDFWRAISFINGKSYKRITDTAHATEIGRALGQFHALLSDLDTKKLHDTLPGFHITPQYLDRFDKVISETGPDTSIREIKKCLAFIAERREFASILEDAKNQGKLIIRPIHGDPKASNILFNSRTGRAAAIIDLDTVGPGLIHYDIGDCLRSCCNPVGEEKDPNAEIHFDTDLCRAILTGYFSSADSFLNSTDRSFIYDSVRLITFELGLRFLTDHLEGNIYFKTERKNHNLTRAASQFKLMESIESKKKEIQTITSSFTLHS
ncbi:MAG: aminoglycoside phosphotransferase family protein [Thermodesulfobacteriota bacterium]|nr:aminoglycoside phosphotransferase family protein [Thermodesulfobacteriota bacterium]